MKVAYIYAAPQLTYISGDQTAYRAHLWVGFNRQTKIITTLKLHTMWVSYFNFAVSDS